MSKDDDTKIKWDVKYDIVKYYKFKIYLRYFMYFLIF